MPHNIEALDHINIRTPDVLSTAAFFRDVLGMTVTPSPGTEDPARGAWICDGQGRAVVHLTHISIPFPWEGGIPPTEAAAPGSGRVHHVALRCTGYENLRHRLSSHGIDFHGNDVPAVGLRQLFVTDPNGVLIELNCFDSESMPES